MALVELAFSLLFGGALGALASAGRKLPLPAWAELFAPAAMAWVCGCQVSLFQREADYMLAYLTEVGGSSWWPYYAAWAFGCVSFALVGSRMMQGVQTRGSPVARGKLAIGLGVLLAGCSALLWDRLFVFGTTLEFMNGLARPLVTQPALRLRFGTTLLAVGIPLVGSLLVVAFDGARAARSRRVSLI